MPQSLSRVLVHLVFSTAQRRQLLSLPICKKLHPYMNGILSNAGCHPLQIGGAGDHVHLLFGISKTISIAQIAEKLKTSTSKWVKSEFGVTSFAWRAGYGAFSVSQSDVARVIEYVANQEEHHKKVSFQDELRDLLREHAVEFDERYLWD